MVFLLISMVPMARKVASGRPRLHPVLAHFSAAKPPPYGRPIVSAGLLAALLGACGVTKPSQPVALQHYPVAPQYLRILQISGAIAGSAAGMGKSDVDRLVARVVEEIRTRHPHIFASEPRPGIRDAKLTLAFTTYNRGSAAARYLAGAGQVRIAAQAIFIDAETGVTLATYAIKKETFQSGVAGVIVTPEMAERDFVQAVVELFKGNP
ncbi:MAG: DUF4410 domain-containing protein [Proteobacteria bacterium]|nr:DUF4410 domain-containing protein [Pseudomonadota bacterium]